MGNHVSANTALSHPSHAANDLSLLLGELPAFTSIGALSGTKLLKSAVCEHSDGRVLVKVYPKRHSSTTSSLPSLSPSPSPLPLSTPTPTPTPTSSLPNSGSHTGFPHPPAHSHSAGPLQHSYSSNQPLSGSLHAHANMSANASAGGGSGSPVLLPQSSTVQHTYGNQHVSEELRPYERRLDELRDRLGGQAAPNVLTYARWIETERAAFVFRQFMAHNVYDRFHTHPFLTTIEKKWLAYQLLEALRQLHSINLRHGDLKTENLVCTTWSWLFLVDLSFFKPTFMPANNPADYSFYYETNRRRCYLAPERFYTAVEKQAAPFIANSSNFDSSSVSEAMDIFSAGCCIAEIFLEGDALFDLPQLLSYKEGGYDPIPFLHSKIADNDVRELIMHMIQLNPMQRSSAKSYLQEFKGRVFPSNFAFVHSCLGRMLHPEHFHNPDQKVAWIKRNYYQIVRDIAGVELLSSARAENRENESVKTQSQQPMSNSSQLPRDSKPTTSSQDESPVSSSAPIGLSSQRHTENEESGTSSTHELLTDIKSFAAKVDAATNNISLPYADKVLQKHVELVSRSDVDDHRSPFAFTRVHSPSPSPSVPQLYIDDPASVSHSRRFLLNSVPNGVDRGSADSADIQVTPASNVLTLIVTVVCVCIQNTQAPKSKLVALDLLHEFGQFVDDEIRLGRLVPYAIAMLNDAAPIVRSRAVYAVTRLVNRVISFPQSDAHIFPEYIFPALSRLPHDNDELVRLNYAANIALLAENARRFLNIAQQLAQHVQLGHGQRASLGMLSSPSTDFLSNLNTGNAAIGNLPVSQGGSSYDAELSSLQELVLKLVIDMLTVGGSSVKRVLLIDIHRLCVFIGRKRVNNELLPHLITVLNDRDWQLRVAFFDNIVRVSQFVGRVAFQNFVLPCVEQSLFDVEETVIQRAVHALGQLVASNLFEKKIMLEIVDKVSPLLCHPSAWIRYETITLMLTMSENLGLAKSYCFLIPALKPFLTMPLSQVSYIAFMSALKPPLTRLELLSFVYPNQNETNMARAAAEEASLSLRSHGQFHPDHNNVADRLRTISSNSTRTVSSQSAASAPLEQQGSGWLNDETLKHVMSRYLQKLSTAVATKNLYNTPDPDSAEVAEDDLASYAAIDQIAPVYQFEIERTVAFDASVTDRSQQDSHDSMKNSTSTTFSSNAAKPSSSQPLMDVRLSQSSAPGPMIKRQPIRQPIGKIQQLQPYILRALEVPPPPPNLGQLRESTLSQSPFYANFHSLEHGYNDSLDPKQWRPRGVLVATLTEHTAQINSLAVSRDNVFIVSGSDDGTVKVWDCNRLKVTANARSQLTWQLPGPVTSLVICDSSHAVASACSSGLVTVMKIEYATTNDDVGSHKYAGLSEVKKIDVAEEGSVLCVEHFSTITQSLLVYGTQKNGLHSWDLRSKSNDAAPFNLRIEPAMGLLSVLAIGPTPCCLIAGTSRGFVVVWDLRFHLPVQVWRHHSKQRIVSLSTFDLVSVLPRGSNREYQHPVKGPIVFVAAEGQNEIAAFDLMTAECRTVLRVQEPVSTLLNNAAFAASLHNHASFLQNASSNASVRAHSSGQIKSKSSVPPLLLPSLRSYLGIKENYPNNLLDESFLKELEKLTTLIPSASVRSTAEQHVAHMKPRPHHVTSLLVCPYSFCLTSGTDRVIRYWDVKEPIDSYRISSPESDDDINVHYMGKAENSTVVFEETATVMPDHAIPTNTIPPTENADMHEKVRSALAKRSRGAQPPSSAHTSAILSMKALEFPQKMIATASSDGSIKVWT